MRKRLEEIRRKDKRYKLDAYLFVFEALEYTQKIFKRSWHVTGRELLEGIKELAKIKYGRMAKAVLEDWGVKTTDDFGEIVFNLVEAKLLAKTEDDKKEDFHNLYSFDKVFVEDYQIKFDGR
ncbi:MAG: Minf_1886 family protein [candidate division WOR-3 bacterium]